MDSWREKHRVILGETMHVSIYITPQMTPQENPHKRLLFQDSLGILSIQYLVYWESLPLVWERNRDKPEIFTCLLGNYKGRIHLCSTTCALVRVHMHYQKLSWICQVRCYMRIVIPPGNGILNLC